MAGYPIHLDLKRRSVLVVGLGTVGTRKANGLIEAGALVTGIDPGPMPGPNGLIRLHRPFRPEDLDGMTLVFACATSEVNRSVVTAAKERGVWVNSASDPESGDFFLPASGRRGRLTISVSTDGASPGCAALARDLAIEAIGPELVELAELLAELRPLVAERIGSGAERGRLLAEWTSRESLTLVRERGVVEARRVFLLRLESAAAAVSDSLFEA